MELGNAFSSQSNGMNEFVQRLLGAEQTLRSVFSDRETVEGLRSELFWRALEIRYQPLIAYHDIVDIDKQAQAAWLNDLADKLDALARRLTAAPGRIAVLDTHILLHYQPPDQIDWTELIKQPAVRLVVPLRVVEKLDEKKYTARDAIAGTARDVIIKLRTLLAPTAGGPTPLRDAVTIEVFGDDRPRRRNQDADEEVLETRETLQLGQPDLVLITGDASMTIRAAERRIATVEMPERYLRRRLRGEPASASGGPPQGDSPSS